MVGFPLLLIPIALYNAIAFLMPTVKFSDVLFSLKLVSGEPWPVTLSDVLLTLGVLLLLLEVLKGARPGAKYLMDHLLSLIVFGVAAAEFVMWSKFASSTYFLLTILAFTDFVTGMALRSQHRAAALAAGMPVPARQSARTPAVEQEEAAPADEPDFDPAPAPRPASAVPAAASIAESVLMDHPEPKIVQPAAAPAPREPRIESKFESRIEPKIEPKAEPKIPSPELQPAPASVGSQEQ